MTSGIAHLRLLCTGVLSLTLVGCATPTPNIDDKHDVRAAAATGVVAGSITYGGRYGLYRLTLTSLATGQTYPIEYGSSQTLNPMLAFKGESEHPLLHRKGSPFAVALPIGRYELKSWQVSIGNARSVSTAPIGVTFDVAPGEAIYLGAFNFSATGYFGPMATGHSVMLIDHAERDLPAIRASFPALAELPITQALNPGTRIDNVGGSATSRVDIPIFIPVRR